MFAEPWLPARRTSGIAALNSRTRLATANRIHGPHLGIGVGVQLLHFVDVVLEGDLLSIAQTNSCRELRRALRSGLAAQAGWLG